MNRLKLDFSLNTSTERKEFLDNYLEKSYFKTTPLSYEELEMCGNYILWGKDADGKNSVQRKEIQIDTKAKIWDTQEVDSLDALMETPTFNENLIIGPSEARIKKPKLNFSREEALNNSSPEFQKIFNNLFIEIDELDYLISQYEFIHNKRKLPPRVELIERISEEKRQLLNEKATHLNQFQYLKKRHLLVELRRQQYTLKDSIKETLIFDTIKPAEISPLYPTFEVEIPVFPLGVKGDNLLSKLIFFNKDNLNIDLAEEELKVISNFIWDKEEQEKNKQQFYFDFTEKEHVYELFNLFFDLEDSAATIDMPESTLGDLLKTLKYYIELAEFNEVQKEILNLKIKKVKNQEIAKHINQKYNKSYTSNYISTIFRQKIIEQINEAARYHKRIIQNIFFKEEFKKCTSCGVLYLKDSHNFVKKSKAKDGFTNRCKKCDSIARKKIKEAKAHG